MNIHDLYKVYRLGDTASHCTYSVDHMISIMDEIGRLLRIEYPTKPIIMAIVCI